jgi:hypothetical protein
MFLHIHLRAKHHSILIIDRLLTSGQPPTNVYSKARVELRAAPDGRLPPHAVALHVMVLQNLKLMGFRFERSCL